MTNFMKTIYFLMKTIDIVNELKEVITKNTNKMIFWL